jgi:hypothetical protein
VIADNIPLLTKGRGRDPKAIVETLKGPRLKLAPRECFNNFMDTVNIGIFEGLIEALRNEIKRGSILKLDKRHCFILKLLGEASQKKILLKVSAFAKTEHDRKMALPSGTSPMLETEKETRSDPASKRGIPLFSN